MSQFCGLEDGDSGGISEIAQEVMRSCKGQKESSKRDIAVYLDFSPVRPLCDF
jgi:hypothetical protein